MKQSSTNKSIAFVSDRGNDTYSRENEMIRIKIDPASCAMLNSQASFLRYSLKINYDGVNVIPDPLILHPFKNIYIYDGNESVVLEQLNDVQIAHAVRNYYGLTDNDKNLQSIYEGRSQNNVGFATNDDHTAVINNNNGGGFQSQFRNYEDTQTADNVSRKAEMIYNFPLSGILGKINYTFPVIALEGLVIRIELMNPNEYFKVQFQQLRDADRTLTGYGDNPATGAINDDGANFTATEKMYGLYGYVDNVGTIQAGALGDGTQCTGFVLANAGTNFHAIDDMRNCSFMPGSSVRYGKSTGLSTNDLAVKVNQVDVEGGRVVIRFPVTTPATGFDDGDPCFPLIAGAVGPPNIPAAAPTFEVSDVQYIANVVQADSRIVASMVDNFKAGRLPLPVRTFHNEKVNITTGALQNEINIPCSLRFVYSVLGVNQVNRAASILRSDVTPINDGLSNYQYVLDSINTPNLPVDLSKLAAGRVDALAIKETQKALHETCVGCNYLLNPSKFPILARRLGVYTKNGARDQTYNPLEKPIKLRVNYTAQPNNIVYNMLFYYYKQIRQEGERRVVIE